MTRREVEFFLFLSKPRSSHLPAFYSIGVTDIKNTITTRKMHHFEFYKES